MGRAGEACVEVRPVATRDVVARIGAFDRTVRFAAGDRLVTERSDRFHLDGFARGLAAVGLPVDAESTDAGDRFALVLARDLGRSPAHDGTRGAR